MAVSRMREKMKETVSSEMTAAFGSPGVAVDSPGALRGGGSGVGGGGLGFVVLDHTAG